MDLYKRSRGEGFGAEVKRRIMTGTYVLSAGYYDAYYLKAQRVRQLINQDFKRAFAEVDVLMGPTAPDVAFEIGAKASDPIQMYLNDIYTIGANLAGVPAMSIPCGFVRDLPVGLQICGPHFAEAKLLNVAHAYPEGDGLAPPDARRVREEGAVMSACTGKPSSGWRSTRSSRRRPRSSPARPRPTARAPNSQANLVDLAYPGVLPVLNGEAVRMAVKFGLAIGAAIAPRSVFARKNYFYPDLPKGYQISQYELPIVAKGHMDIVLDDGTQEAHRHHARAPRRGRRQVAARRPAEAVGHRPESRRHAAHRDRLRAGHALGEGGRGLSQEGAHAGALPRDLRRQHAGRLVPLRRQRVGAQGRRREVRHARRDQEHQLVPLRREGDQLRSRAPDRS